MIAFSFTDLLWQPAISETSASVTGCLIFNKFKILYPLFCPLLNHLVQADKLLEVFMEFRLFHDDQKLLESVKVRLSLKPYKFLGSHKS